jgi:hypothetical protein
MINGRVSSIVLTGSAGEWLNPFLVAEKMMEPVHDPINARIAWRRRQRERARSESEAEE